MLQLPHQPFSLSAISVHSEIKFKTRADRELDAHPFNYKAATALRATTSAVTGQQSEPCKENLSFHSVSGRSHLRVSPLILPRLPWSPTSVPRLSHAVQIRAKMHSKQHCGTELV